MTKEIIQISEGNGKLLIKILKIIDKYKTTIIINDIYIFCNFLLYWMKYSSLKVLWMYFLCVAHRISFE